MQVELTISIIAVVLSGVSLICTTLIARHARRCATLYANATALVDTWLHDPTSGAHLKFHDVSDDELAQANVTKEELSYAVASLLAGWIEYRAAPKWMRKADRRKQFEQNEYRGKFIRSSGFRTAWPVLQKIMSKCPYTEEIQRVLDEEAANKPAGVDA